MVLQDLEMFSSNMGLNNDWYLPTEPSITQIFAGDSSFHAQSTPTSTIQSEGYTSGADQSLSRLPTEREAVGKDPQHYLSQNKKPNPSL